MPADELHEIDSNDLGSVDDFLRELEAKEKDLHITSDLSIEIEDSDIESPAIQEFLAAEVAKSKPAVPTLTGSSGQPMESATVGDERISRLKARVTELERENVDLNQTLKEIRAERNEIQETSDRRVKDFENFKHRMDRERRGSFIEQLANMASQMLPVLDNMDRALNSVPPGKDGERGDRNEFYDGIYLVNQQLNDVLVSMGIEPISTKDQIFDPSFHEAVATDERDDLPHNTVVDELLRGYRIGNRVVRHSMVRVSISPNNRPVEKHAVESADAEAVAEIASELETFAQKAFKTDDSQNVEIAVAPTETIFNEAETRDDGGLADMIERFDSNESQPTPDSN